MASSPDAYTELLDHFERFSHLQDAAMTLRWDQLVMMPKAGTPARSTQHAALSAASHDAITADELIERATGEPLTADYFVRYVEEKFTSLYGL